MKRFWVMISCTLVSILLMSTVVFASVPEYQVGDIIDPPFPVVIVEGDHASSDFYQVTRDIIRNGWSNIQLHGSMKVLITANTLLTKVGQNLENRMYLVKYDPITSISQTVAGPFPTVGSNEGSLFSEQIVNVVSTGYYYTLTHHIVDGEIKTSQSPAIHVTY